MPRIELALEWGMCNDGAVDYAYARLRGLGLTAYGETRERALTKLFRVVLPAFIDIHRDVGDLEQVLRRVGELEKPS